MSLTADVTPFTVKPHQPKQWLWPVVISILAHALLLLLSKQKLDIKASSDSTEPAIQSYLYIPPAEVVPQVLPEPEEKTMPPPAMEVPAREQVPESEAQLQPEPPEKIDIPEETTPATVSTEPVATETEQNNAQTYNWSGHGFSGQLSNQLQQLQQQQYQNMLNQQTQGYTRQWDQQSVRPSTVPELSPEQALRQATQITTDCDKGLNKTLAFLSGISGGTVKCSDNGNVKKFIQQRLNKKHQLP